MILHGKVKYKYFGTWVQNTVIDAENTKWRKKTKEMWELFTKLVVLYLTYILQPITFETPHFKHGNRTITFSKTNYEDRKIYFSLYHRAFNYSTKK